MSPASAAPDPPSAPTPSAFSWRRTFSRIVLLTTLLLGLWLGYQEFPREVARWYLAAAAEHRVKVSFERLQNRQVEANKAQVAAAAAIEKAIHWDPKGSAIYMAKAAWELEDGNYSAALADCDRAAELGATLHQLVDTRGNALIHLKRYQEAVSDAMRYRDQLSSRGFKNLARLQLNQVAYYRSLGKVDLQKALAEIDESLAGIPRNQQDAARLDTRGHILYQMGRYPEAIVDLDRAAIQADAELAFIRASQSKRLILSVDPRNVEIEERRLLKNLAVIYFHRSQVLERLNRWRDARRDRLKAKELIGGEEPDSSLF